MVRSSILSGDRDVTGERKAIAKPLMYRSMCMRLSIAISALDQTYVNPFALTPLSPARMASVYHMQYSAQLLHQSTAVAHMYSRGSHTWPARADAAAV